MAELDESERRRLALNQRLALIERERAEIAEQLAALDLPAAGVPTPAPSTVAGAVTMASPTADKVALFRSLFRGREDVFPRRWDNAKTGKSGYAPVCRNEWVRRVCDKPRIKCSECPNQAFVPFDDAAVRAHLRGRAPDTAADFTAGLYAMRPDERCWFLAADFDKASWRQDVAALRDTARSKGVPIAIERSRSGNGAHAWIFFAEPVPAAEARRLGALLVTATMERHPDLGFDSYDRFFPSQDTMPAGGFGNLIALPLQRGPRAKDNSVFVDDAFNPHRISGPIWRRSRGSRPPRSMKSSRRPPRSSLSACHRPTRMTNPGRRCRRGDARIRRSAGRSRRRSRSSSATRSTSIAAHCRRRW